MTRVAPTVHEGATVSGMDTAADTTTTTYRVQVAAHENGRRWHGHTRVVDAPDRDTAAAMAVTLAAEQEAAECESFNRDCEKFGTNPRKPYTGWTAEKVRKAPTRKA